MVSSDEVKADLLGLLSRANSTDIKIKYQTSYSAYPPIPSSMWTIYRKENLIRTDISSEGLASSIYALGDDTILCTKQDSEWACANSTQEDAKTKTQNLDLTPLLLSLGGNFTMSKDQTFFDIRCTCYQINGGSDFLLNGLTITPNTTELCFSPQGNVLYSRMHAQADWGAFEYTLSALSHSPSPDLSDFTLPAALAGPIKPSMEMIFYDLEMGEATLIETTNLTILIDTGTDATAEELAKILLQRDISKIDVLLISSWDTNKLGGLESIFKRFSVGAIWVPGDPPASRVFDYPWAVMHQVAVLIRNISAGDKFNFSSVSLEVFNPPTRQFLPSPEANSVVMRISYHDFCAFMPGDIEEAQHVSLVSQIGTLPCAVYKWPYHGRGRPEASLLFDRLKPSDVIISVGKNKLGLPSPTTLERLRISNVKIWRTDLNGDISINATPDSAFTISAAKRTG